MSLMRTFRMDILQTMSDAWRSEQLAKANAIELAAERLHATGYPDVESLVREADDVTDDLLSVARSWHADIIMAGSSGKSAVDRFLLGSISTRIARHAPCAVWLVRAPKQNGLETAEATRKSSGLSLPADDRAPISETVSH